MWQTIDTAPQDGTRVLLFIPSLDDPTAKVVFGHYVNYETLKYGVSVNVQRGWSVSCMSNPAPTHWQPIPADPA